MARPVPQGQLPKLRFCLFRNIGGNFKSDLDFTPSHALCRGHQLYRRYLSTSLRGLVPLLHRNNHCWIPDTGYFNALCTSRSFPPIVIGGLHDICPSWSFNSLISSPGIRLLAIIPG